MPASYELAVGDHAEFPVYVSQKLRDWFEEGPEKALLWMYKGGGFDPHPGFVSLLTNTDPVNTSLHKLRGVLHKVLGLDGSKLRNGDIIDGCTVCFTLGKTASRGAILIVEGDDFGTIYGKEMENIFDDVDTEIESSAAVC